ncbi:MAG: response regulator transcription factor [Anaerolineae bacterium]|nr:MAG: response regulator transcription factor [Anaerolineae bacterium]MCL4877850.1 response regulator transcription factor [Anaerolineae bacterium]
MTKILIIEDDPRMLRMLEMAVQDEDYDVLTASNGLEGLRKFHNSQPDLVVLDVKLPMMDGVTVCQRIRELSNVPVLMLSATAIAEEDIAKGLEMGADEYVRKPIGAVEFRARLKALLRRAEVSSADKSSAPAGYSDEYLNVDVESRRVSVDGVEQRLTPTEFKLLATFIRHRGQVLTFQQLLEQVWGYEYTTEHHYPRIYVSHLRRKIEPDVKNPVYIQNEYGIGYRFVGRSV